ncbi:hypothetical protein Bca52824_026580 [Brassica carinata]|uniref:Uncharacterized protein n=1 Tax=Brassica carinata TaxID=52824 RepID=A0A8X7SID6_BRACI|nr:hypothetical protein Bca52824_026580 [Brassica carinata]
MEENPMFVPVPFQQVLQRDFDNTYPIGTQSHLVILLENLLGWVTSFGTLIESEEDPYGEMFGRVKITNGGPCSKFEFDPTWI